MELIQSISRIWTFMQILYLGSSVLFSDVYIEHIFAYLKEFMRILYCMFLSLFVFFDCF